MYYKVSPTSRVHIVTEGMISYEYNVKGYVYPICGLTSGPKINATKKEYEKNGCKGCKKAIISRAIAKMQYGV